jgi:glutaredoxin
VSPKRRSPAASIPSVRLYGAQGCSLCDRARTQLERLQAELAFDLEEVDITGVAELEARHREWLPVVEIDGERAFVYFVDETAFRRKVSQSSTL